MVLTWLDWLFIGVYLVLSFAIALYFFKRAGKNTSQFFLTGRNMPWWLAGTSMVATTFAADTPLAVTEMVADSGIAGNWLWWNMLLGGMLTVFFFARLWRRSGVLTDVEFVEIRYSGRPASWLRGIKAIYFGLVINIVIMGWVSLAMESVINVIFPDLTIFGREAFHFLGLEMSASLLLVGGLILGIATYSLLAGLWGIAVTDAFQFLVAFVGTTLLAVFALRSPEVGGLSGLMEKLPSETFNFFPSIGSAAQNAGILVLSTAAFIAHIGIQWWSSWYPGAEPGGGGYIAQRIMSAKDEKHSLFATLWFNIAHYCVRPWPWIIVALVSLVMFPNIEASREGFVMVMRDVLPTGLLGLLLAAFLAAFMSTLSTQLNWGTSYIVNDFWRRFIKKGASEKHYVLVSRITTFAIAILSFVVTTQLEAIKDAWQLILTASGGLGLVLILRWYWWRINAWSELVAHIVPIIMVLLVLLGLPVPGLAQDFPLNLFYIVSFTTVLWLAVTFATSPTKQSKLDQFYRKIKPGGIGWKPFQERHPDIEPDRHLGALLLNWMAAVVMAYSVLFGVGHLLFQRWGLFVLFLITAVSTGYYLYWDLSKRGFEIVTKE